MPKSRHQRSSSYNSSEIDRTCTYVIYALDLLFFCSSVSFYDPIELRPEEDFTKQRASIDICHFNVTSPVVIIVRTLIYRVCANIKVRNNNICECAPFAKFVKIIDCEHFVTYGI